MIFQTYDIAPQIYPASNAIPYHLSFFPIKMYPLSMAASNHKNDADIATKSQLVHLF